jgi:hypothetical protein
MIVFITMPNTFNNICDARLECLRRISMRMVVNLEQHKIPASLVLALAQRIS